MAPETRATMSYLPIAHQEALLVQPEATAESMEKLSLLLVSPGGLNLPDSVAGLTRP